jgi:type II secretory pathway component GspD/PulD (secretin)
MSDIEETVEKVHYICQTYTEKTAGRSGQVSLQIGKQFQYTSASQAQERAERESRSAECVGADAYMVIEDPSSGEVGPPTFLVRLGRYPEDDTF